MNRAGTRTTTMEDPPGEVLRERHGLHVNRQRLARNELGDLAQRCPPQSVSRLRRADHTIAGVGDGKGMEVRTRVARQGRRVRLPAAREPDLQPRLRVVLPREARRRRRDCRR